MPADPVAVVTGAARGVGAATVHRLARDGWRVVAVDRCADDPDVKYPLGTRAELAAVAAPYEGRVLEFVADVRDPGALAEAAALATDRFDRLDAAVAAAAVMAGGEPLWESSIDQWQLLFDVCVHGVANLARAAVPRMLAAPAPRRGRFVAVASAAAHHGLLHLSGYNAAKHAVLGLTKGLAHDLRGTGITSVAVSPGSTRTAMLTESARLYGIDDPQEFAGHHLIERIVEPDEVAAAIAWLCSGDSGAVTGTVLQVDGGFLP